jgi:peptidoglycan hydrolase-like protein with peptidoglycan-binding domain
MKFLFSLSDMISAANHKFIWNEVALNKDALGGKAEWAKDQLKNETADSLGNLLLKEVLTKDDVIKLLDTDEAKQNWTRKNGGRPENSARYVLALQAGLKILGYESGTIDALFGGKTKAAVIAFQTSEGLKVDGAPGPQTIGKMLEKLRGIKVNEKKEKTEEVDNSVALITPEGTDLKFLIENGTIVENPRKLGYASNIRVENGETIVTVYEEKKKNEYFVRQNTETKEWELISAADKAAQDKAAADKAAADKATQDKAAADKAAADKATQDKAVADKAAADKAAQDKAAADKAAADKVIEDKANENREKLDVKVISRKEWGARAPKNPEDMTEYKEELDKVLNTIVVHHSEMIGQGGPKDIQNLEMDRMGYDDSGYHFIIDKNGNIYEGRPINLMGAHAGRTEEADLGARTARARKELSPEARKKLIDEARKQDPDYGSIGICLDGDFNRQSMSAKQKQALENLLISLKEEYKIPGENIIAHSEVKDHVIRENGYTFSGGKRESCPGKNGEIALQEAEKNLPEDTPEAREKLYRLNAEKLLREKSKFYNLDITLDNISTNDVTNLLNVMKGDPKVFKQELSKWFKADFNNEYLAKGFQSGVINLNSTQAKFGYRNQYEYNGEIKTQGILIPLNSKLALPKDLIGTAYGMSGNLRGHEGSTVVGVDIKTNKILVGTLKEHMSNPNARLSLTTRNNVLDIPLDKNKCVIGRTPRDKNGASGFKRPEIKALTDAGKEIIGSISTLFKPGQRDRIGGAQSGSIIIESQDKKRLILVSGSSNQLAKAYHLFKGGDKYATIYNLDNGTFCLGFHTKNGKMTEAELKKYDIQHENNKGGNGLYLLP